MGNCIRIFNLSLYRNKSFPLLPFFFPFSFGCTCGIWKFLGQGSNWSWCYDLHHSYSNAGSLTCYARPGIKPPRPPQRQARSLTHSTTVGIPVLLFLSFFLSFFFFFLFSFFRVAPEAYGRSQARG